MNKNINETSNQDTVKNTRKIRTGTKAEKVRKIVLDMKDNDGVRTKDIIAAIMDQVGFKKPAASTYYYNALKALKSMS